MEFRILGPLEVRDDHGAIDVGGSKPRAVLAVLLLHANEPVSAERLAMALWGPEAPPEAVKRLQVHVSRLRKALKDPAIITTTTAGYSLRVRPGELDAEQFAWLVDEGRSEFERGHAQSAAAKLRDALALWRGPPLADLHEMPFAPAEVARLDEHRLTAIEARVEADLATGRHATLVGELRRLLAAHGTRERFAAQLMVALYRSGRQAEALDVFTTTRHTLVADLGAEPGPELRRLHEAILRQDRQLDVQPHPAAPVPPVLPYAFAEATSEEFEGRDEDLAALASAYATAAAGERRILLIGGEPGIGKTRLCREFALHAHARGTVVLYGRCDDGPALPYQPFAQALRQYVASCSTGELAEQTRAVGGELTWIMPELHDLPAPLAGDPEGARARLFEAVGTLLSEAAQRRPLVLVLDDLALGGRVHAPHARLSRPLSAARPHSRARHLPHD